MKIIMSKRKGGIYAQWYVVAGIDKDGKDCWFLIYHHQAKNYAQAVKYWNKSWGHNCKALYLQNAEPMSNELSKAC